MSSMPSSGTALWHREGLFKMSLIILSATIKWNTKIKILEFEGKNVSWPYKRMIVYEFSLIIKKKKVNSNFGIYGLVKNLKVVSKLWYIFHHLSLSDSLVIPFAWILYMYLDIVDFILLIKTTSIFWKKLQTL